MVGVKVCGLTRVEDAVVCADAGVDALGLNFWPGTPRCVSVDRARAIADAVRGRVELVGVFVDAPAETIAAARDAVGLDWIQLHGDETPEQVVRWLPGAYKAFGVARATDIAAARRYPGERLLLDARVPGAMPGGTGVRFDWALATDIARERALTLAGGLHPGNVAKAIAHVRPARVDVASGVERAPGVKDAAEVAAFVRAVREAAGAGSLEA